MTTKQLFKWKQLSVQSCFISVFLYRRSSFPSASASTVISLFPFGIRIWDCQHLYTVGKLKQCWVSADFARLLLLFSQVSFFSLSFLKCPLWKTLHLAMCCLCCATPSSFCPRRLLQDNCRNSNAVCALNLSFRTVCLHRLSSLLTRNALSSLHSFKLLKLYC